MEDLLGPSRRIPRNWRGAFPQHCPGPHKAPIQARFQYTATLLIRGLFNHPQLTSLRCRGTIIVTNAACLFSKKSGTLGISNRGEWRERMRGAPVGSKFNRKVEVTQNLAFPGRCVPGRLHDTVASINLVRKPPYSR